MRTVNEILIKEDGYNSVAQYITEHFTGVLTDKQALVCCIDRSLDSGYILGIATKNEKGYKKTWYNLKESNYNKANNWIKEANKMLFPDRTEKENFKIDLLEKTKEEIKKDDHLLLQFEKSREESLIALQQIHLHLRVQKRELIIKMLVENEISGWDRFTC